MPHSLLPTAEDTIGPYYPLSFLDADQREPGRNAGVVMQPLGQPIVLTGRILDMGGSLVAPALAEFWQADSAGRFRGPDPQSADLDPWFDGYARQYCSDGVFWLRTIMPGVVAQPHQQADRAPHVTLNIFCDGFSRVVTQIFFADQPANDTDPLLASLPEPLRARLTAKIVGTDPDVPIYGIDIVLRGPDETPFFDDLLY